ncbi:hypothetical protein LDG_6517 [Legionella drancourtii LLAP12]|uniref:Uncharacterized protein n=1 Tax=Legionella drancourtii LLAP12 TaxID=658187 RepID=G9EMP7_9GAMM|nr:hypothetical protein LDG_6517 [Legionella drancourtii LLAP12]
MVICLVCGKPDSTGFGLFCKGKNQDLVNMCSNCTKLPIQILNITEAID